jgi:hypothetical protein
MLTGNEHFTFEGTPTGSLLRDFWAWQSSGLLNNTLRGVMAEFIVGNALGVLDEHRETWEPYDLTYKGKRIEVKTSSSVQEWEQESPSPLTFSIASKDNNDMYIFCAHLESDRNKANPLILDQWLFFPALTSDIIEELGEQKTARIGTVQKCYDGYEYDSLHDAVIWVISGKTDNDALQRISSRKAVKGVRHGIN